MFQGYPFASPGLRVGLLGGSFDPPHAGHVHITYEAFKRFRLDQVWWLVSPGNPLKAEGPADLTRRMTACAALVQHPRVIVTDIENRLGTRPTIDTLRSVRALYPQIRFTWLMGADNLVQFHRWANWAAILHEVPVGVLARPREQIRAGLSATAQRFDRYRLPQSQSQILPLCQTPKWCMVTGPMIDQSSTALRRSGAWVR